MDVRANFVREEPLGLQCWISATCVVEDVSIHLFGHCDFGILSKFRASSIFPGCKQILHRLLVLHNQVVTFAAAT